MGGKAGLRASCMRLALLQELTILFFSRFLILPFPRNGLSMGSFAFGIPKNRLAFPPAALQQPWVQLWPL